MSNHGGSVCVFVRAFNASAYILECLKSLKAQTYKSDIFIKILYDEGSKDDTQKILENLDITDLNQENRNFEIIYHENLSPFRSLFNYGFSEFAGKYSYYTILDYDNYYRSDYIELTVKQFSINNNIGFLYSMPKFVDKQGNELQGFWRIPSIPTSLLKYKILMGNFIDANTIFMKQSCLDFILSKIQKLTSKTFDWIHEDWVVGALALTYCNTYFLPGSYIYYRVHDSNINYVNKIASKNGTIFNRELLSLSALSLLFEDKPISKIITALSLSRLGLSSLLK